MDKLKYIAVVDDHVMLRKGLAHLINLFPDYRVLFEADHGKDFIDKLKPSAIPDIVLLDINMPVMDGYATANWIRINYPDIKVITLSMLDNETAIIKMIQNGSRGYILKDAHTDELRLAFKEVLEKGYYYNELVNRKLMQSINVLVNKNKNDASGHFNISEREMEFLKLACSEKTYPEIASLMFLSARTIDGYRESLFGKLNVTSRVGMVIFAIRNGLVHL
jgi:DNA-binding NarL/FixJ family response regulator